jgi:3-hydroxyisobutyrate dehydrogenase
MEPVNRGPHHLATRQIGQFWPHLEWRIDISKTIKNESLDGAINPGRVFDYETDLDHIADAYRAMELAAAARARGVGVLDAPVGGGVPAAHAGTLQVFVGGDATVLDQCRPVLEALADPKRIIRVGGNGAG